MTHKKAIALLTGWIVLVVAVIFSAQGRHEHTTQHAPTPKYEVTHGGAILPSITMPESETRTGARDTLAEQGSEVEACCASAVTDANGHVTKPSPTEKPVSEIRIQKQDKKADAPAKPKPKKQKHHSHSGGHSGGHSSGHPPSSGPLGSTFPAPPFSPAFGAFA